MYISAKRFANPSNVRAGLSLSMLAYFSSAERAHSSYTSLGLRPGKMICDLLHSVEWSWRCGKAYRWRFKHRLYGMAEWDKAVGGCIWSLSGLSSVLGSFMPLRLGSDDGYRRKPPVRGEVHGRPCIRGWNVHGRFQILLERELEQS